MRSSGRKRSLKVYPSETVWRTLVSRMGTLLGTGGRPEAQVQIIRKGKKATRIKWFANYGRSWVDEAEQVDTDLILDDGGRLWNSTLATPVMPPTSDSRASPWGDCRCSGSINTSSKPVSIEAISNGARSSTFIRATCASTAGTHPPGRTPSIMTARPSVTTSPGMTTSTKTRLPRSWPRTSEKIVLPIGDRASRISGSRPRSRTSPGSAR